MTLHLHRLEGCAPRPLSSYLKALAVLRLVSEQADPEARGRWHKERFELITRLSREELEAFFLEEYKPTPILSPWNGSQFEKKQNNKEDKGIDPIERSTAGRFKPFRVAIQHARASLAAFEGRGSDKKKYKPELLAHCQRTWRGPHEGWLDVSFVLNTQGEPSYPALLGTGGNDGKLDFPNNQMQRLAELFDVSAEEGKALPLAHAKLKAALWGSAEPVLEKKASGMYAPSAAGGVNSSTGLSSDSYTNAFDFVLTMEGTLLFRVGLTRQLSGGLHGNLSAPFSARSTSSGYSTASSQEGSARGEQWFPLWGQALKLSELTQLLSEGRASLKRKSATQSADLARSIAHLGVNRGLSAFERYGYLKRNGESHFIVPLGRFEVKAQPQAQLIDDLDAHDWLSRLRRASGDERAPTQLKTLTLRLEEAMMRVCAKASEPALWQQLLTCLDEIERLFIRSASFCKDKGLRSIPPLSAGWGKASADGSAEHRLALCLALSASPLPSQQGWDGVRRHWVPRGEVRDTSVVCAAQDPLVDLTALIQRRVLESSQRGLPRLTLRAHPHASARFQDLEALLLGELDLQHTLTLARAFMALKQGSELNEALQEPSQEPSQEAHELKARDVDVRFALIRLVTSPYPLSVGEGSLGERFDPEVLRRLASGDLDRALEVSLRRLRSSGFRAPISHATGEADLARLLLASLAFPVSKADLSRLARAHLA